jgi:inhibitor of KinA
VSGYRIVEAGDSALAIEFEARIDAEVNARVIALAEALESLSSQGVRDIVPAYRTVTVFFDPLRVDYEALVGHITRKAESIAPVPASAREPVRVPVCYGGELGPDLDEVAAFGGVTCGEVIRLHTAHPFRVFMLGFMPGFPYLGPVDNRIAAPRRSAPRLRVPAGSVALAGQQTGIIPTEAPSGWRLIGRTPVRVFDLGRADPFLVKPGDQIQFYPIDRAAFDRLAQGM